MQTGLQMSLLDVPYLTLLVQRLGQQTTKLLIATVSPLKKERLRIALSLVLSGQDGRCIWSLSATSNTLNLIFLRKVLIA